MGRVFTDLVLVPRAGRALGPHPDQALKVAPLRGRPRRGLVPRAPRAAGPEELEDFQVACVSRVRHRHGVPRALWLHRPSGPVDHVQVPRERGSGANLTRQRAPLLPQPFQSSQVAALAGKGCEAPRQPRVVPPRRQRLEQVQVTVPRAQIHDVESDAVPAVVPVPRMLRAELRECTLHHKLEVGRAQLGLLPKARGSIQPPRYELRSVSIRLGPQLFLVVLGHQILLPFAEKTARKRKGE
mmetsp:Transcript_10336/g.35670  ORF Transcript_10336/g.35670 Transcript_10336/m.35670 type:complete len:241 (-) Transcript_10336:191-913(-)